MAEILDLCAVARDLSGGWFDPWAVPGGFDPSGYVKGWAAQNALAAFRASGICGVLVNAAGDIASSGGLGDGTPFRIGIADPFAPLRLAEIVELTGAIATSGTYERGEHLIDPRFGAAGRTRRLGQRDRTRPRSRGRAGHRPGGGRRAGPRADRRTRRLRGARHQPRRQQAADATVSCRRGRHRARTVATRSNRQPVSLRVKKKTFPRSRWRSVSRHPAGLDAAGPVVGSVSRHPPRLDAAGPCRRGLAVTAGLDSRPGSVNLRQRSATGR